MLYQLVRAGCIVGLAAAFAPFETRSRFDEWKSAHSKAYATVEEESRALAAFASNDEIIEKTNAQKLSYTLGHNKYSDLTWDEFRVHYMADGLALHRNYSPKNAERVHLTGLGPKPNDAVDWVTAGAVTPVKDQGRCGSCWAFSTTGSVEGAYQIASGTLTSLSEEDLVSCDHNGDMGCGGGLMDHAFQWIETNGICTESDYPYAAGTGHAPACSKTCAPAVTVTSFTDVPKGDETALLSAVAKGPVSIAIEADKSAFQLYKSGVLDNAACGTKLDHGVLVVGYGTDSALGKDYWKVKNSWGATWGEEGYIRMVRDKNQCGISDSASYPTGVHAASPSPPGPGPSPPPAPGNTTHYEDPNTGGGCMADEVEITIQGVAGDVCSPSCTLFSPCPTDVPVGVTARPQCALKDSGTGKQYCALMCSPTLPIKDQKAADAQCGTNASCKTVQAGIGLCTYDDQ
jgi:C1A family cysteine protease